MGADGVLGKSNCYTITIALLLERDAIDTGIVAPTDHAQSSFVSYDLESLIHRGVCDKILTARAPWAGDAEGTALVHDGAMPRDAIPQLSGSAC